MNRTIPKNASLLAVTLLLVSGSGALAASAWTQRMFDQQNTTNVGTDAKLTTDSVPYLKATQADVVAPDKCLDNQFSPLVNHTPIVSDGLLMFGDWCGFFYVWDIQTSPRKRLIKLDTHSGPQALSTSPIDLILENLGTYLGVQATPVVATLTGGQKRIYVGVNSKEETLWCLNVSKIIADRDAPAGIGPDDPGTGYLCSPPWPGDGAISLAAMPESGTQDVLNGSPIFRAGQTIKRKQADGSVVHETHDVLFTPSTGLDCANGQFFAIDALSGEHLWTFDPVEMGNGQGGTIWTMPALSRENPPRHLFLTTGDCVQKPQIGEKAESLIALDPETGKFGENGWYHQRRLTDTMDFDIGNAPNVVDVDLNGDGDYDDPGECRNIVSTDKDGCIYGFRQERDIPDIGEEGWDPLRQDQQRVLWRQCFVPGSLGGGFDASVASFDGRNIYAQAKSSFGLVPGDDTNAFALDACSGTLLWASSTISPGWGEGAIASGMYFQAASPGSDLQVVAADAGIPCEVGEPCFPHGKPKVLASVNLPQPVSPGGGGAAIVDGKIYLPSSAGVVIVSVDEEAMAALAPPPSPPAERGDNAFKGPYPLPLSAAPPAIYQPIDPNNPYPLDMGLRRE